MNSLFILFSSIICFVSGYCFYAKRIEKIWQIDPNRATPAIAKNDGVDFVPSKNWFVLFGHHFASIAGAGPIVGPAIACMIWGWGPALLWVVLGSIFFGGIHDFGSLMISVRENGVTIGDVASKSISYKAKIILSIFMWLALILVIAVFAYLGSKTFVEQPEVVIPSFGIIPIAVLLGLALYKWKINNVLATIIALAALIGLLFAGTKFPIKIDNGQTIWLIILFIYCYFASIMPVNVLLQPRDYLSSYLLLAGVAMAFVGIVVAHPTMNSPVYVKSEHSLGYLWPMMFITIACGANSGFHSLVSSGTTSKQIANETHAKRIGFGGMLMEGFVATLVIILIAGGFSLNQFNVHVANKVSPINLYGMGFGNMTQSFLGAKGTPIAITILSVFILTTLDSAARITRYLTEELFGIKNRFLSTAIIVVSAGTLAFGKDSASLPLWQKIWPAFGASNQLVAALALLVISCWLLGKKRPVKYSLLPGIVMLITSITALVMQTIKYFKNKEIMLIMISLILIGASLYLIKEVVVTFIKAKRS